MLKEMDKKTTPLNIVSAKGGEVSPGQYVKVIINNNTPYEMNLVSKNLEWGLWGPEPAAKIPAYESSSFQSNGDIFAGTEGSVEYAFPDAGFYLYWDLPQWGDGHADITRKDPNGLYNISLSSKETTVTIGVSKK